jgi:hypothetical protein
MNIVEVIRTQLSTEPAESKKYRMVAHGMWIVMGIFGLATLVCYMKPEIAGHIAGLAQMTVTAIGGLVAVYAGAQAAVEYKANSVLQTNQQSTNTQLPPAGITQQGASGAPAQPPFTPSATS